MLRKKITKIDFQLLSKAFKNEENIPDLYTCKGKNVSPPLRWNNPPKGTKSFVLTLEDLDTPFGTITHWVIYNIPAEKRELSEAIPYQNSFPDGTIQGKNGMWKNGYMGPCPLWGKHRYYFKIYALDTVLKADSKINKKKLLKVIEDHILNQAHLMGYYSKKRSS